MGIYHHDSSQIRAHTIKHRTGCGSIPTNLDPTKQATDWGVVDLAQICCAGDCLRATIVIVVPDKRQTTSLVDAFSSTRPPEGMNGLIELDIKT